MQFNISVEQRWNLETIFVNYSFALKLSFFKPFLSSPDFVTLFVRDEGCYPFLLIFCHVFSTYFCNKLTINDKYNEYLVLSDVNITNCHLTNVGESVVSFEKLCFLLKMRFYRVQRFQLCLHHAVHIFNNKKYLISSLSCILYFTLVNKVNNGST
jgi:hypothetical protein